MDGLSMILGDDGVFREYDDSLDITIHFQSEKEKDDFLKKFNADPREDLKRVCGLMCDKYCKYPFVVANEELLQIICNKCPLNDLIKEKGAKE